MELGRHSKLGLLTAQQFTSGPWVVMDQNLLHKTQGILHTTGIQKIGTDPY